MATDINELLNSIMSGQAITAEHLEALLASYPKENQYLEYKHGEKIKDAKEGAQMIREYVSGFANADGGMLCVGVGNDGNVTGAAAPGGGDLCEWASRCLTGIASFFSPLPRFLSINCGGLEVLVIAVLRSTQLVPCPRGSQMAYHFRFHDQTLSAPDYLVADVLLGRRQRPNLAVSDIGLAALTVLSEDHEKEVMRFRFGLNITIENMGLLTAEAVHVGIVYFDVRKATQQRLSSNLLSFIDVVAVNEARFAYSLSLKSTHMSVDDRLFPFSVQSIQTSSQTTILLPIRLAGKTMSYSWKAAVYVTCEASPPIWHQVTWTIDEEVIGLLLRGDPGYEHLNRTAQRVQQ